MEFLSKCKTNVLRRAAESLAPGQIDEPLAPELVVSAALERIDERQPEPTTRPDVRIHHPELEPSTLPVVRRGPPRPRPRGRK
jgi:hypothetical protein